MTHGTWHPHLAAVVCALALTTVRGDAGNPPTVESAPAPAAEPELARLAAEARRAYDESFYAKAEVAAQQLRDRTESIHGAQSVQAADALDLLVQCRTTGPSMREPETRRLAASAVELRQRLHGERDARYARSLCNQAVLLQRTGAADEAVPLFEKALQVTEGDVGPNHPQVATILNGYGDHFRASGEDARAMALFQRALAILEATAHPDTLELTLVMNRMAVIFSTSGDYISARRYYDRVLALREARYGLDHPRVTGILSNLGILLEDMGDSEAALEIFIRVRDTLRRTLDDPYDARIGVAMLNAAALTRPANPEQALCLYDSALVTLRRRLGGSHELVARCLHGLGATHRDLGHIDAAIAGYESALAVAARLPPDHLFTAFELRNLASLHFDLGQIEKAREESARALKIAEEFLGNTHPEVAEILGVLGLVEWARGDTALAVAHSLRAEQIATTHLRLISRSFAEREALLYAASRPQGLDLPLSTVVGGNAAQRQRIWDVVVRSRALVLDEMASRSGTTALSRDAETAHLVAEVRRTSTRLAKLIVSGPSRAPEAHSREVDAARQEKDAAERALAAHSEIFRHDLNQEQIGFAAVKASLPSGCALVAFAEYSLPARSDPSIPLARRAPAGKELLAFVLDPHGQTYSIRIGTKTDIEALVHAWIRQAGSAPGSRNPDEAFDACWKHGLALRRAVWDPIEPYLGYAHMVFIVPEGALHRVNFPTLPLPSGRFLVETNRRIHTLTAERDLVTFGTNAAYGEGLVVFGGADFDAPLEADSRLASRAPIPRPGGRDDAETRGSVTVPPCAGLAGVTFRPLRGTLHEAELIAGIWEQAQRSAPVSSSARQATVLTADQASESALKAIAPGKRVLHLATHGFVLGSDCPTSSSGTRGIHPGAPVETQVNPLLLSGLALAGANQRDTVPPEHEDGILTAEEVTTLNLQGVEWAVLSGCDTGVGEVQTGEGVLGLRRAFQIAGARSLIMSLWSVSDDAACRWMEALYTARFRDGLDTAGAVHEATKSILEARRRTGQSTHPFYWAGFVAAGDWK